MFYFTMIVFGLSQQMALVHTVASGLISIRPDHFLQFESSLTFMSCLLGLVFSFPMATEVDLLFNKTLSEIICIFLNLFSHVPQYFDFVLSVRRIYRLLLRLHNWLWMVDDGSLCADAFRNFHHPRKTLFWRERMFCVS